MSNIAVSNLFVTGQVVDATQFNTNYSDIVTYINNRNDGSDAWDAFHVTHGTNIPLIVNNSTGVQDIFQAKDNGTMCFQVPNGGIISFATNSYVRATKTSDQDLANANSIKVTWDEASQTGSAFSTADSKFTAPSPGKYLIVVQLCLEGGSTGSNTIVTHGTNDGLVIYKNGSEFHRQSMWFFQGALVTPGVVLFQKYSDVLSLGQGDYIEVYTAGSMFGGLPAYRRVDSESAKTSFEVMKLS